jgi:thiamine biosynthesis lipoprotein
MMLSAETGHILSPQDGRSSPLHRFVSVSAPRAALADGLSTAGCLMTDAALDRAVAAFPLAKLQAAV